MNNTIIITLFPQQIEFLTKILSEVIKENRGAFENVMSAELKDKINGIKELECEEGHTCTSSCGNDTDCPCESDHCCSMTSKYNLCGDIEDCAFCASKVPDLADLANDNLNEK